MSAADASPGGAESTVAVLYLSVGFSLLFLGTTLAAASIGGGIVLRRMGQDGPSCALSGAAAAVALSHGVLAVLPSPPIPAVASAPLLMVTAALGVGWTTDTASKRLPHTVANTTLAAVALASYAGWRQLAFNAEVPAEGLVIAAAAAPAVAGILFAPPSRRSVWLWHLFGAGTAASCAAAALLHPEASTAAACGLVAVIGVGLGVLAAGHVLVRAGQAGAGDPVWVAAFATAAASHAVLSAGRLLPVGESLAVAVIGASMLLVAGGVSALVILSAGRVLARLRLGGAAVSGAGAPLMGDRTHLTLAGQWTALGIMAYAAVWKLTPLGASVAASWLAVL